MATGKAPFDHHLKGIRHAFEEMVKPYTGTIRPMGTQFGFVTFEISLHYQDETRVREVGPFDMAKDFDHKRGQDAIGKALAKATKDVLHEMMDPHGECKTISVKETYESISG